MGYQRPHIAILKKRLMDSHRFIQVLYGPRQVGKTTAVHQLLEIIDIPYHTAAADAVPHSDAGWIERQWDLARLKLKREGAPEAVLVIDEIQKCENWSETVKKMWDDDSRNGLQIKVLLLGSSRLLLQHGLTESLAGRYEVTYMGHWSYGEMREAFGWDADRFVWFGGYPGAAVLVDDEPRWEAYVRESLIETSVSRDILMMTRVDKPALMKRLFELGSLYSGQILSYTKMLGQLHDAGNTTTLAHYLELLDTAGLLAGIEKFTPDTLRQRASSPKFQVHNTALISAQSPRSFSETKALPEAWGRFVESAVGAHLLNFVRSSGGGLRYWRHGNDEIDFVLSYRGRVAGIEVKSGTGTRARGMDVFAKTFSPDKMYLVGGDEFPWHEFLLTDPAELI